MTLAKDRVERKVDACGGTLEVLFMKRLLVFMLLWSLLVLTGTLVSANPY